MTAFQFGRAAVGMSLLATGLSGACTQLLAADHACPPVIVWLLIALTGFVLVPKPWGRKARGD